MRIIKRYHFRNFRHRISRNGTLSRSERLLGALGAGYLIGVAAGAIMSRGMTDVCAEYLRAFCLPHSVLACIMDVLRPTLLGAMAFTLTGLSLAGAGTAVGLLIARGLGVGWLLGGLYQIGTRSALFCALAYVLPMASWTALLYLIQARESIGMAMTLLRALRETESPLGRLRLYGQRSAVLWGGAVSGSLVQSLIAMAVRTQIAGG